jgi:hypothetical protein
LNITPILQPPAPARGVPRTAFHCSHFFAGTLPPTTLSPILHGLFASVILGFGAFYVELELVCLSSQCSYEEARSESKRGSYNKAKQVAGQAEYILQQW